MVESNLIVLTERDIYEGLDIYTVIRHEDCFGFVVFKTKIADDAAAIFELVKYALTLPAYFRNFGWKKAEQEADDDIKQGRVKSFSSVDEFLADLKA